jgi:hypothetical protein
MPKLWAKTGAQEIGEDYQHVISLYASAQSEHFCVAVNTTRQESLRMSAMSFLSVAPERIQAQRGWALFTDDPRGSSTPMRHDTRPQPS